MSFLKSEEVLIHGWQSGFILTFVIYIALQIFFLQGRLVFGPDVRSLVLTIFLVVAPVSVFCVFVARKLMYDFEDDWGISVMVVAVLFTIHVSSSHLLLNIVI